MNTPRCSQLDRLADQLIKVYRENPDLIQDCSAPQVTELHAAISAHIKGCPMCSEIDRRRKTRAAPHDAAAVQLV